MKGPETTKPFLDRNKPCGLPDNQMRKMQVPPPPRKIYHSGINLEMCEHSCDIYPRAKQSVTVYYTCYGSILLVHFLCMSWTLN